MELSSSILPRNTLGAFLQSECQPQEAETSAQGPVEINLFIKFGQGKEWSWA